MTRNRIRPIIAESVRGLDVGLRGRLTLVDPVDLAAIADDFDREVVRTPEIDRFCSSTAWVLSAAAA